jgi:hypothetical protein
LAAGGDSLGCGQGGSQRGDVGNPPFDRRLAEIGIVRFADLGIAKNMGTVFFANNVIKGTAGPCNVQDLQVAAGYCANGAATIHVLNNRLACNNASAGWGFEINDQTGLTLHAANNTSIGTALISAGSGGTINFHHNTFRYVYGNIPAGEGDITGEAPDYDADGAPNATGNCDGNGDPTVAIPGYDNYDQRGNPRRRGPTICRGPVEILDPAIAPDNDGGIVYPTDYDL